MIQESRVQEQTPTTTTEAAATPRMATQPERTVEFGRYAAFARVSWGAVIAGTIAAIAAQVLLASLGLAIGLTLPGSVSGETMGIFGGIWWLVAGLVSLFIGGWVAGRYTGIRNEMDSALHGVMTWALVTTLSVLFLTTFGGMLAGSAVGAIADDLVPQQQSAQTTQPQQQQQQQQQPQQPNQADQQASALPAEQLSESAAGAAWWTFFALLLGVIAAGIGGYVATPSDIANGPTASTLLRTSTTKSKATT